MNTLEIKAAFSSLSGTRAANVFDIKEQQGIEQDKASINIDKYSPASANDVVAAKVLSFSIGQRFETSLSKSTHEPTVQTAKLEVIDGTSIFDIGQVVNNVLDFVGTALTDMARNGADEKTIQYFKEQASDGVKVGVEQAKADLANVSNDALRKSIDNSRDQILERIQNLPSTPDAYLNSDSTYTSLNSTEFAIQNKAGRPVELSFGAKAFVNDASSISQKQLFTSQASNLSFSVTGAISDAEAIEIANVVNQVDDLATTFYRKNIEGLYNKATSIGFDDAAIVNMSNQKNSLDKKSATDTYQNIKLFSASSSIDDMASVKAVANYVTRLMDVKNSSERELASQQDYNEVINGLVNQMKDVQVPDLLQAINRFHAFNAKFVASE